MHNETKNFCSICKNIKNQTTILYNNEKELTIFEKNIVIIESSYFQLIPDVHPISSLHLLIISKEHYVNMSELPFNMINELTEFINSVNDLCCQKFNAFPVFFEHGSLNDESFSGNSIFHFHLHVVLIQYNLFTIIDSILPNTNVKISTYEDLKGIVKKRNYLLIIEQNEKKVFFPTYKLESQFLRKIIFENNKTNLLSTYDWKTNNCANKNRLVINDMLKKLGMDEKH